MGSQTVDPDVSEPQQDVPQLTPEQLEAYGKYRIWKKNSPQLYSIFMSHMLPSPALSFQWLPDKDDVNSNVSTHRFLSSSYTACPEVILLGEVKIPINNEPLNLQDYSALAEEIGGYQGHPNAGINTLQSIPVLGEVNRVRYMPQNPNIIATIGGDGSVFIFDKSKHPANPGVDDCKPDISLSHHQSEGWSVSWNKQERGNLLSCSADGTIALWDVVSDYKSRNNIAGNGKTPFLEPKQVFSYHEGSVNDVTWHPAQPTVFASVGDDHNLCVKDIRDPSKANFVADTATASLSIALNPFNQRLVATSGEDGIVNLWDIRSTQTSPLGRLVGHQAATGSLDWSPHDPRLLVSGSDDNTAVIWDVSKIEIGDGSEKVFVHAGHTEKVTEVGWNPSMEGVLGSVAFNSLLHVWKARE